MLDRVTGVAADAGLEYRFDLLKHTNTVKAHELLHFAKEQGRQHELAERLMSAYFTEGRHLGRDDELVSLAVEAGLDADAAREALQRGATSTAVRADQAQAAAYGISGVPFFVIDGKYGVSGAQPAEAFAQIVRQVWAERREPASETARSGCPRPASAREVRLDELDDRGVVRLRLRAEPAHLAVGQDDELLEVPLDAARLAVGIRGLLSAL